MSELILKEIRDHPDKENSLSLPNENYIAQLFVG
jgi:hypothetical protein